jgi:hypothetical protein
LLALLLPLPCHFWVLCQVPGTLFATARDDSLLQSLITIGGANFGVPSAVAPTTDVPSLHSVRVGTQACTSLQWLSDDTLRCVVSGDFLGGAYTVWVEVDGEAAVSAAGAVVHMECPRLFYGGVEVSWMH